VLVAACVKWTDLRPDVDRVHGTVHHRSTGYGFSRADRAAVEVALRLGAAWGAPVAVLGAGPAEAATGLAEFLAAGADRAVRLDDDGDRPSELVAADLAAVLSPADLAADMVVCGDYSADRGSGTVPAYLAHHLGAAQALGLVSVEALGAGRLRAVRRLDGGRRELLEVSAPAVVSVEGSVAELRRAPLGARLSSGPEDVEVRPARAGHHVEPPRLRPWRPRTRVLAPPRGDEALERVVHLTGALVDRSPPRTVELGPAEAAEAILDQLRAWGYLP
jgi:electron transfer flavoprotein beta subunit